MTASLLTSLLLAVTWTPGLAFVLLEEVPSDPAHPKRAGAGTAQNADPNNSHPRAGPILARVMRIGTACLLERSLARPLWLGSPASLLVARHRYLAYRSLGSDLLPAMDEGGFILDYIMPAGSSLTETNRVLAHVEQILQRHTRGRKHQPPHRPPDGSRRRHRGQHRRHHRQAQDQAAAAASTRS